MAITDDDITFDPNSMFARNPAKRQDHKDRVRNSAPDDAVSATIVNGFHTSRSDATQHITVDYYDAAGGKVRQHVY
ncbi:Uncharacterized protein BP5553_07790 [Venustampulla echinocandica]|uniref:Uncharacterized protein n=1 Tax=Venustampulla echinocandica TaxID=2656787 RepID=A0A370THJ0_9HELO|nr:Uncharacterized protein BP5553_07790 [Venustampulla echinocandica]RDL34662.1 Uncharacterized protein BP5553_07790 [Venustampulla echinocandica]